MNKRMTVVSIIVALLLTAGWGLTLLSAHAAPTTAASQAQDSNPPSTQELPGWEYKILVFPSFAASRKSLGYGPVGWAPANLEDELNKLAELGFVVESFQTNAQASGTGYEGGSFIISGSSEIVVLLKRAKK